MISFESDYTEGCVPEILEALNRTNNEQTTGYGMDYHCENARNYIRKACGCPNAEVQFLVGGTQANTTVIAAMLKPYQGVICASTGHINVHETGAIEATGHKCLSIPSTDGKLYAKDVKALIEAHWNDESFEHTVQPGMIYISFPTETGLLYSKKELAELHAIAKHYSIPLFVDGARMGYGLQSKKNDLTLKDFAKLSDVFYIGGTKVGALFGEAVVIPDKKNAKYFRYMIKQHGGMLAKGRLLGIQFEELFKDGLYLQISRNACACAEKLASALTKKGYKFYYKPQTNQLFPIMSIKKIKELRKQFAFLIFVPLDKEKAVVRFVTSYMTKMENVDALIKAL